MTNVIYLDVRLDKEMYNDGSWMVFSSKDGSTWNLQCRVPPVCFDSRGPEIAAHEWARAFSLACTYCGEVVRGHEERNPPASFDKTLEETRIAREALAEERRRR